MGIHSAEVGKVGIGDTVVVLGTGSIGLASIFASRLAGASAVIAVDLDNPERLKVAQLVGARKIYRRDQCELEQIVDGVRKISVHGLGADVVINATGMPAATVNDGLKLLRNGGTYVDVGSFSDTGASTLNFSSEVLRKGIKLHCVPDTGDRYFVKAVAVLENGDTHFEALVSHQFGLEKISDVFHQLTRKEPLDGRQPVKVLLDPN
jgi:threonine dehydrogenase-like Zn-dependent dehydrogenase